MKGPIKMPLSSLHQHPRKEDIFGMRAAGAAYDAIKASMVQHGQLLPLIVTPPTAVDHPLRILDGDTRAAVGREIGLKEVLVLIDELATTEAEQIRRIFELAKRKDFTWSERARQLAAVDAALAGQSHAWFAERGLVGKSKSEAAAIMLGTSSSIVDRLRRLYTASSRTEALLAALDDGKISLHEALRILTDVEKRRRPGSEWAKRLVNERLAETIAAKQVRRHRRAPRTVNYSATPKPRSFLTDVQKQLVDWAVGEIDPRLRSTHDQTDAFRQAVKEFMVSVRTAAGTLQAKVRRLSSLGIDANIGGTSVDLLNDALEALGLAGVGRVEDVKLDEVRSAHRRLARMYHPDINDTTGARDEFERVQGAYQRVLEICG